MEPQTLKQLLGFVALPLQSNFNLHFMGFCIVCRT